jgi:DNA-directed RNA polymerase subunit RPC12/RpoP
MVIKGCARCGGDMYDENDIEQVDLVCLQCGFRRTITSARSRTAAEDTAGIMRWLHSQRPRVAA